jgi:hypothetical protein
MCFRALPCDPRGERPTSTPELNPLTNWPKFNPRDTR